MKIGPIDTTHKGHQLLIAALLIGVGYSFFGLSGGSSCSDPHPVQWVKESLHKAYWRAGTTSPDDVTISGITTKEQNRQGTECTALAEFKEPRINLGVGLVRQLDVRYKMYKADDGRTMIQGNWTPLR